MARYRVAVTSLHMRAQPKISSRSVGFLHNNEIVDGLDVSSDAQWYKIRRSDGAEGWSFAKFLSTGVEPPVTPMGRFPWMPIAYGELGVEEAPGAASHPRILEYLGTTTLPNQSKQSDETPWCSAFVNWCVERAGYEGTNSAAAISWRQWGKKASTPELGCIAVFRRQNGNHVGFYLQESAGKIRLLGGNQSNAVGYGNYNQADWLAYRIPG